jgi:hypothetical protein
MAFCGEGFALLGLRHAGRGADPPTSAPGVGMAM